MKKILLMICACTMLFACSSKDDSNYSTMTGKEKLVVAIDEDKPYAYPVDFQSDYSVYVNSDQFYEGFDVRVARYLASSLEREIEVKKMSDEQANTALKDGEIDLYLSAITKDELQEDNFDYLSYYQEEYGILVNSKGKCTKFEEISKFKKKKVGVISGDTNAKTCLNEIEEVKAQDDFASWEDALKALSENEIDGIIAPLSQLKQNAKTTKNVKVLTFEEEKGFSLSNELFIAFKDKASEQEEGIFEEVKKSLANLDLERENEWMNDAIK